MGMGPTQTLKDEMKAPSLEANEHLCGQCVNKGQGVLAIVRPVKMSQLNAHGGFRRADGSHRKLRTRGTTFRIASGLH